MNRNMPRSIVKSAGCAVGMLVLLVAANGCATKSHRVDVQVCHASETSKQEFVAARELYQASRERDDQGAELRANREELIRKLWQVTHLEPNVCLYHSRLGEARLDLGPDAYSHAHTDLLKSTRLCKFWVPGWLGLARYEMLTGNYENAEQYLGDAEDALTEFHEFARDSGADGKSRRQSMYQPANDERPTPQLSKGEMVRELTSWLTENEAWEQENPLVLSLSGGDSPQNSKQLSALERRLRARIEYLRAANMIFARRPAEDIVAQLDKSLEWDSNFNSAVIEKAVQFRALSEFDKAESLLEPFVRPGSRPLGRSATLLCEMASIYAARYANGGGEDWYDRATNCFTNLLARGVSPRHARGLYAYGLHVREGAVRTNNPAWFRKALEYIDMAMDLDPNLPGIRQERARTAELVINSRGAQG